MILAPSPLIPGLKIYLSAPSCLRIELVAHNEKQAFNGFFMRGELIGDVLPRMRKAPGTFDEWRAQYWHPYAHPIIINLSLPPLPAGGSANRRRALSEGSRRQVRIDGPSLQDLSSEIKASLQKLSEEGILWLGYGACGLTDIFKKEYRKFGLKVFEKLSVGSLTLSELDLAVLRYVIGAGGVYCPYSKLLNARNALVGKNGGGD
jgi:hypothetical protein